MRSTNGWTIGLSALLLAVALLRCGDEDGGGSVADATIDAGGLRPSGRDASAGDVSQQGDFSVVDTSPDQSTDIPLLDIGPGDDPAEEPVDDPMTEPDPCDRPDLCAVPALTSRCEDDTLVLCTLTLDGCYIESRTICSLSGEECGISGGEAECREPQVDDSGETCSDPLPLTSGVQNLDTSLFQSDYVDFDACGSFLNDARGPDVVWSITLQPGQRLTVSMESSDTDFDVVAAIGDVCPALEDSCLDYSDKSIFLDPEVVTVTNTGGAPHRYFVIGAGDWSTDAGPLRVTTTIE